MTDVERRSEWQFLIVENDRWQWLRTRTDGTEERSSSSFDTLKACADDAKRNGWAAWKSEERRQSDPSRDALDQSERTQGRRA